MDSKNQYALHSELFELGVQSARLFRISGKVKASESRDEFKCALSAVLKAHEVILRRFGSAASVPTACEWILDNRHTAVKEAKLVLSEIAPNETLRSCNEGALIFLLCSRLVSACLGTVTEASCREFLNGVQTVTVLSSRELSLFPLALRHALIVRLGELSTKLLQSTEPNEYTDGIRAIFVSFETLSAIDMAAFCRSVDKTEEILLCDPTGVYGKMSDMSKSEYRRRLEAKAKRLGVSEHEYAEALLKTAKESGIHIGCLLFDDKKKNSSALYIAANVLLTLFLPILCGFLSHSVAAALLLLLPFSELTKSFIDYILLLCVKPRFLPRLELESGIPDEGRSICVLSVLLSSPDAAISAAKRLEAISLLNRDGTGNLNFGLLADLPEANSAVTDKDSAVIATLKTELCALNLKYGGGFFLFTRPRTEADSGVFCGFERKRGAVLALSALLCGHETELHIAVGDEKRLCGTRYIITLDADTVPSPDSLRELIGAALHPMNRCVMQGDSLVSGYGIIHPRIGTEQGSVCSNDFARIFGGLGGTEPYGGLSGDVYMDLFGSGGFYGKGLIDANALYLCSKAHIPDGEVLSHDALEGAYLHGAFMSDVEFCDSFPSSPLSYYRRLHRWTRGDWQNAPWAFSRKSGLSDIDRFKLFDSLRRSLVAPMIFVSVFLGLLLSAKGLTLALTAAILSLAVGALISLSDALCGFRRKTRYHSSVLHGVGLSLLRCLIRLWLLPYEAWICVSAASVSLWRMLVSRKKLLQWETSAQSGGKKHGPLSYILNMWFAILSGAVCIFASHSVVAASVGLLWMLSPLMLCALSLPCRRERSVPAADRRYLLGIARDIWGYFSDFCTAEDNYLPPDNFQAQPPIGLAHRTSPTNIGLAMCAAMCAAELGIDGGKGIELIENMLGTLERMPKKYGHFYNWYDTRTLRELHPKYLSTVDCGNLLACLIAVKNGLVRHRFFAAAKRVEALYAPMDLSLFYDKGRRLMYIGIDADSGKPSTAHYDLLASEARLTSYIAVSKGDVPKKHWQALSRAMRRYRGYTGMASWTGTMFEYLMPELFLPLQHGSLMFETAKYCVFVQKHRRSPSGLWGISESGFFSLDASLSYRYKAHGCSALALKRGQDEELVISPYSSFLALKISPDAALRNIRRMEDRGLRGRYGFIEALDLTASRCSSENGEAVRSYMAHHLGMSLLAIANYLDDNTVVSMMLDEPFISAYRSLLCEKLPIEPMVLDLPEAEAEHGSKRECFEIRGVDFDFQHPHCCILTNGAYNVMLTESGVSSATQKGALIYASPTVPVGEGHGIEIKLSAADADISLLPEPSAKYKSALWELGESSCSYSLETDDLRSRVTAAVSGECGGELRIVELCAKRDIGAAQLVLSFEPVLAAKNDYVNHPAYWRLGMCAESYCGCLMLHRLPRGAQGDMWLCLASDRKVSFSADRNGGLGAISKPCVFLSHALKLHAGERISLRFCLCAAEDKERAFEGALHMLAMGPTEYGSMVSTCAAALKLDGKALKTAMNAVLPLHFFMRSAVFAAREKLWKYGISGDRPIVLCPFGSNRNEICSAVKRHCLLLACGLECDLVFLSDEGGDYFRPVYSAVRDTLCAFGLEALLGDGGSIRILPQEAEGDISACASFVIAETCIERSVNDDLLLTKPQHRSRDVAPEYDFADDGAFLCYVNSLPPRAWTHTLTNGSFSFLAADNGCGNMWFENAREMRISPWRNDPLGEHPDETLEYVNGQKRISLFAADDGFDSRIRYGFGYARWERSVGETGLRCTAFVPISANARVLIIELCGSIDGCFAWKLPLELGGRYEDKNAVAVDYVNCTFEAHSERSPFSEVFRAAFSAAPLQHFSELYSWQRQSEAKKAFGSYPIFGALLPADTVSVIVCGCCDVDVLKELCKPNVALAELEKTRRHWQNTVSVFKMKSGEKALDHYLNGHGLYQALACRLLGRCSIYQSGGAVGFRDQLQDAVNLIFADPSLARRQIIVCCEHQYTEGDVMHWWHSMPDGDRGVRTRCSDDLLWLVWALCEYVEKTGDSSICDLSVHYVNSSPLLESESDRYESPQKSELSETVLLHAKRAADCVINRGTGLHGLLFFGSGDWNDGMDRVHGESVWLSWFFAHTVRRFSDLLLMLCKLEPDRYRAEAERIGRAAEASWDGAWYLRGYWPDGTPLGSAKSAQCRIDSICQSWAAFCADSSNSRVDIALGSALDALYDRQLGIVKLFTPPFFEPEKDPGYIASYGEGFRENGGQYTHAAIWLAIAALRRGREKDGFMILRDLLPENHDTLRYEAEPFVLPADISSAVGHMGEAGWTGYTGSAAWYLRAVVEELLGLRLYAGKLYIRPHLPEGFAPCRIRYAGREICINGEEILLDGEKYDGKGIPYLK